MKHIMGNGPKCIECYWYREKQDGDHCRRDGWCMNEHNRTHDIAGKKRPEPKDMAGRWTDDNACPFCGFQPWYERDIHTLSFCPNCGADMRGKNNGKIT